MQKTMRKKKRAKTSLQPLSRDRVVLPHVHAALICEKHLREGNVFSFIRIVDTVSMPDPTDAMQRDGSDGIALPVTVFVSFKAGEARSKLNGEIYCVSPTGKRQKQVDMKLDFTQVTGPEAGVNIPFDAKLKWDGFGMYTYEVMIEGTLVTRIFLNTKPEAVKFSPT